MRLAAAALVALISGRFTIRTRSTPRNSADVRKQLDRVRSCYSVAQRWKKSWRERAL